MSSRQGGKQKPLKQPKREKGEDTEEDIAFRNKLKDQQKAEKEAIAKLKKNRKMSDGPKVSVTDDHKNVIFAFIRMVQSLETQNPDVISSMCAMLGEEFGVDPGGVGGEYDKEVDIVVAYNDAVKQKQGDVESDEKFVAFLDVLTKKGYFDGVEEGSDDHKTRMERAKQKFSERSNPYKGLTAEQIKNKGNEFMSQGKYKEAIAYYTKAIEMDSNNHIYYANRAAAHTHLKDYRTAVIDCERAVMINNQYSKAYSRMGTALFYDGNYARAVEAFSNACDLDPDNETYKADLKQAEERLASTSAPVTTTGGDNNFSGMPGGFPGMPGGFPGMPGGFPGMPGGFEGMSQMMQNPQFMEAAQRMMQNPEFSNVVQSMASRMGGGAGGGFDPEMMRSMMQGMGTPDKVDDDGNVTTPFGKVNRSDYESLQAEAKGNPKLAAAMADVQANGFSAMGKYMNDPDFMALMTKFQSAMFGGAQ